MKNLTASDRSALIRLASSLPAGSEERRAILAGLKSSALSEGLIATGDHVSGGIIKDLEERVRDTIEELKLRMTRTQDFQRKLKSGSLEEDDEFLDFTEPINIGYDAAGPSTVRIEMG